MAYNPASDSNCQAWWRLEDGAAITTDSSGKGNTLTNTNVTSSATCKEGAASADFESAESDRLTRTDADLSANFPLKSGTSNKILTVCLWFRAESLPPSNADRMGLYNKWTTIAGNYSFTITLHNSSGAIAVGLQTGYNSGNSYNTLVRHASSVAAETWYHVGVSYDDSDMSYRIRIWDDGAQAILGVDKTGTMANAIALVAVQVALGANSAGSHKYDGLIDDAVVFNRVLTADEIDQIRAQTFPALLQAAVAETVTLSESITARLPILEAAVAETVSLSESVVGSLLGAPQAIVTDSLILNESVTAEIPILEAAPGETVTLSESVTAELPVLETAVAETVILSESVVGSLTGFCQAIVTDDLVLSESAAAEIPILEITAVADALVLSESIAVQVPVLEAAVAETVNLSESVAAELPVLETAVAETLTLSESVIGSVTGFCQAVVTDDLSLSESISAEIPVLEIIAEDGLTLSESMTARLPVLEAAVADMVILSESVAGSVTGFSQAVVTDSLTLNESVAAEIPVLEITAGDGLTLSESTTAWLPILETAAGDTLILSESVAGSVTGFLPAVVTDSLTLSESAAAEIPVLEITAADGLTLSESTTAWLPILEATVAETVILSDLVIASGGIIMPVVTDDLILTESITVSRIAGYEDYETSLDSGEPYELHEFHLGDTSTYWRYADAPQNIEYGGNTFAACYCPGGEIQAGSTVLKNQTLVKLNWKNPLAWLYTSGPPEEIVHYIRYRGHGNQVQAIFRGDVVQVIFRQSDRKGIRWAEVTIDPLTAALARTGLIARYSRQCCVDLYDDLCGVDRDDFEIQGTITAVAGNVLTSPLFGLKPNHWFRGGDILVRGCRRGITAHTGEEITIGRSLPEDVTDRPFSAWPGCDHLRATCEAKFDDLENFRGQSNIPDEDVWSQWGIV